MNNELTEKVKAWLNTIMPSIVVMLTETFTKEKLTEMGKDEGVHGPLTISLSNLHAPITAVHFYVSVVDDAMLLATTANIEGEPKDFSPDLKFDLFFPIDEFETAIKEEENMKRITERIMEIYKEVA